MIKEIGDRFMNRTIAEIDNAIAKINAEISRLPHLNAFGDSNESDRAEMQIWVGDLVRAKLGHAVCNEDVQIWLANDGKFSALNDMGV
jgi:hypothetical protein